MMAPDLRPRISYVRENARRTAKHVTFELHSSIERHVVLDLYVVTYHHAFSDEHILAENTILTNTRPAHHVGKMPDLRTDANITRLVNVSARMDITRRVTHPHSRPQQLVCSCSTAKDDTCHPGQILLPFGFDRPGR